jgi:hypothetical protein
VKIAGMVQGQGTALRKETPKKAKMPNAEKLGQGRVRSLE